MNKVHLIMPMAGRGTRFSKEGFDCPKPLINIYGKPFFYWATQSIKKFIDIESLDYVVLKEHVDDFEIDRIIKDFFPEARVHILSDVTEGAVITSMKGIADINDTLPVVFNDCDHLFKCSEFNKFVEAGISEDVDGILLTFEANEDKYSFVGKDSYGNVNKTVEKKVISNEAICGCYYFKNVRLFNAAVEKYLNKCSYNEYYMSGVYNIMIDQGNKIVSMKTDYHIPFGVPAEYDSARKRTEYLELK